MNTYNIGPLTMQYVFKRANLTNVWDLQAVFDAVEDGLARSEEVGYSDGMNEGLKMAELGND